MPETLDDSLFDISEMKTQILRKINQHHTRLQIMEFIKRFDPTHIPQEIIEAVRGNDYEMKSNPSFDTIMSNRLELFPFQSQEFVDLMNQYRMVRCKVKLVEQVSYWRIVGVKASVRRPEQQTPTFKLIKEQICDGKISIIEHPYTFNMAYVMQPKQYDDSIPTINKTTFKLMMRNMFPIYNTEVVTHREYNLHRAMAQF